MPSKTLAVHEWRAAQLLSQRTPKRLHLFWVTGKHSGDFDVLIRGLSDELRQVQCGKDRCANAGGVPVSLERDHRDAHPQRVQGGSRPVIRECVERDIYAGV